ncbi:MAG: RHS repeat-associated core domain-containing protein [Bacteroidales bacterium]|nr:RHS repeat-associated core domain-containing protein [Bacteroidales bacterium]
MGDFVSFSNLIAEYTNKGTLASVTYIGQLLEYFYDRYDRLIGIDETRSDTSYHTGLQYDNYSRVANKTYPSGYKVYYEYFPNGSKKNVKDARGNILWRADEINASGLLLQATTGNGAVTTNKYDAANRLISSATSGGIQNFAYTFDGFGNLTSRTDSIGNIKTESLTYDNLDRLTGISLNNVSSTIAYDTYGRMTSKQKNGTTVFESAQFSTRKPHALTHANTTSAEFPNCQTIDYNASDKVEMISQGTKKAVFTYGYDTQRIKMNITDTLTNRSLTKDYVGGCEFVDDNGTKKVYTYLTCQYGVFAMVVRSGGTDAVHYVYKDHLGSWTTVTDSVGTVVERKSFDAWGNLRDPQTWSANLNRTPRFDRGFTGHEHLYAFGLINMNGRMYDPLMSSFLSPDNYIQDPTTQQGFNRYAYCAYNPLKYVDPSGEQYFGWNGGSSYYDEQAARLVMSIRYNMYLESMQMTMERIDNFSNSLWSQGDLHGGAIGGNGCHGGGSTGGNKPKTKHTRFNEHQLNAIVESDRGKCVLSGLGSMMTSWDNMGWGETTKEWVMKEHDYCANHPDKEPSCHGYEAYNLLDFITWDNNGKYNTYKAKQIGMNEIYDYMDDGWVVAALCRLYDGSSHYANVTSCTMYGDGAIDISFLNNPLPKNTIMALYHSNSIYEFNNSYESAMEIRFIAIKLIHKIIRP